MKTVWFVSFNFASKEAGIRASKVRFRKSLTLLNLELFVPGAQGNVEIKQRWLRT